MRGWGGGGWGGGSGPPYQFSKKGALIGPPFLEGVTLPGGCKFYIKNKLKSEIFNDEKSL